MSLLRIMIDFAEVVELTLCSYQNMNCCRGSYAFFTNLFCHPLFLPVPCA